MKGKILGFMDSGGVITGDDGKRYKFTAQDWRAPRAPRVGEEVDYEISAQGLAAEIYPLRASAGLDFGDVSAKMKDAFGNADLSDVGSKAKEFLSVGSSSQAGNKAMELIKNRLSVPLAILLLVTCFALSFIGWEGQAPGSSGASSVSVVGISDFTDNVGAVMGQLKKTAGMELSAFGGSNNKMAGIRDDAGITAALLKLLYLLYLIPLGAALILWREWQGRPARLAAFAVGGLSVAGFLLGYLAKWSVNATLKEYMGDVVGQLAEAAGVHVGVHIAFGAWVLLICGVLLTLNALGMVRLGARA